VLAAERQLKKSLGKVAGIVLKNYVPLSKASNGALNVADFLALE
jgi:hypothetical protein